VGGPDGSCRSGCRSRGRAESEGERCKVIESLDVGVLVEDDERSSGIDIVCSGSSSGIDIVEPGVAVEGEQRRSVSVDISSESVCPVASGEGDDRRHGCEISSGGDMVLGWVVEVVLDVCCSCVSEDLIVDIGDGSQCSLEGSSSSSGSSDDVDGSGLALEDSVRSKGVGSGVGGLGDVSVVSLEIVV